MNGKASTAIVAVLLVITGSAGCFDVPSPEGDEPPESPTDSEPESDSNFTGSAAAFEAATVATETAETLSAAARLVWVSGRETPTFSTQTAWEGTSAAWTYGFYDPSQNTTFTVSTEAGSTDPQPTGFGAAFDELDLTTYADSTDIAALTQQANGTEFVSGHPSNQAIYWLTAINGTPLWTIVYWVNETSRNVTINAETGEIVPPDSEDGRAAIPIGFKAASAASRPVALQWHADAVLVEAYAIELVVGGTKTLKYLYVHENGAYIPPDSQLKDGLAPVWALLYHSNDTALIRTILVYGTGGIVAGTAQGSPMTKDPDTGERRPVYNYTADPAVGSVEAAARTVGPAAGPDMRVARYHLRIGVIDSDDMTRGMFWQLSLRSGDMFHAWVVDAQTGDVIDCPNC